MKRITLPMICLSILLCFSGCSQSYDYPFQNPKLDRAERVNDLVSRLTLEEKISQMMNDAPAIERLGIPAYNWWNEGLHGVARSPYRTTMFPQAIGMAATFDKEAMHQTATYISDEGRAIYHDMMKQRGNSEIYCGLTYWSPNINIFRDPRWGRGQETYGEDPYLTGQMGMSFVNGIQGDDPDYLKAAACAKHYAVHSGPEWNRHTFNAVVSRQDLWDTYLPAFRDLVVDAGVAGVMGAYNALYGEPCCENELLLMDILRGQWGFDGYVVSDCGAIDDIYRNHKAKPDAAAASASAVLHSTDCECGNSYRALADAVQQGLISEDEIDRAVRQLFDIRFRMGMFDPDKKVPYASIPLSNLECPEHQEQALKMARESIVLLKNDGTLPLDLDALDKIAVVGPNADEKNMLLANYYGFPSKVTSILEGIREKAEGKAEVIYEKGVNYADNYVFVSEYDESCFSHDGEPGFGADYYQDIDKESRLALSRHEDRLDYRWGDREEIAPDVVAKKMSAIYTTTFTAKKDGQVCFHIQADDWADFFIDDVRQEKLPSVQSYYLLDAKAGQSYELKIFYTQHNETGEIKFDVGKMYKSDYKQVAKRVGEADVIIFVGGLSSRLEGEEMPVKVDGFKGGDRTSIKLPAAQTELLKELYATGKPVVLVLCTGSALSIEWEDDHLAAILCAWYGGQAGGEALADVLAGDYNPAGRLPVTFYRDDSQLPDFEDYSMDGRTYRYFSGDPLYPFGYGLSYTAFDYSDLQIEKVSDQSLKVSATVTNSGSRAGDEVVQLYISNPDRDFRTPIRALKGFERITLAAGESRKVEFELSTEDLSVVDNQGTLVPMEGRIVISVAGGQTGGVTAQEQL